MNNSVLLRLLLYFGPLSFLTIGGGTAVVSDIHRQVVNVDGWLTDAQFLDLFALSRMIPGPGTLLVSMIGWKVAGFAGAVVASIAIFLPSSLLFYGLARLWARYRGARWQQAVEIGLTPIAAGMVLATSFTLLSAAQGGALAWVVAGASAVILTFTRINPFVLLGAGAVVYVVAGFSGWPVLP